jgi:hypothetical protein
MRDDVFTIPDEFTLLEFFGTAPLERRVADGYWCYEITDTRGSRLRFSFHRTERSVETVLQVEGVPPVTVRQEGARLMTVGDRTLTCDFTHAGGDARLVLWREEAIRLEWSGSRKG